MTDHPDAVILDRLSSEHRRAFSLSEESAVRAGAAAIRALAQFRPHHPAVVVSSTYAVLHVPFDAVLKAREALGDFDLGRFDVQAAQSEVQRGRDAYNATLDRDDVRAKWGA
jgi:hypothetical protein